MGLCGMLVSYLAFCALHFLQFVLAITVCGLYGVDLHNAAQEGKYIDAKWVYAEVVGSLSAVTAVVYSTPCLLRFASVWIWNAVLFCLWAGLVGVFGSMYINQDPRDDPNLMRMKNAVWVDLVSAVLWLVTTVASFTSWLSYHRERRRGRRNSRSKV